MVTGKSHPALAVGACLLLIGGGVLPIVLTSPPELYAHSANRIDEGDELSPAVIETAATRKSTVTDIETVDEHERQTLRNAIGNGGEWTAIETEPGGSFDYEYVIDRAYVFEVQKKDDPPAVRVVELQGKEKVETLSFDATDLSDRAYFGVRRTDTQSEVVQQTIERKRYDSFTRANVDGMLIERENRFYRISAASRQNSVEFMLWSFSVVFLSLSLLSGIFLLAYPIANHLIRAGE